jgi:hypothetical protein
MDYRDIKIIQSKKSMSFLGLLTLLFIALKLTGVINWSWWLVWLPLYGPWLFVLGIGMIFLIIAIIVGMYS